MLDPEADTDVGRLEQLLRHADEAATQELEAFASHLEGGFLDDLALEHEPEFLTWRTVQRLRLSRLHGELLHRLIQRRKGTDAAVEHARRLVTLRPDDELAWATLIREQRALGHLEAAHETLALAHRELGREGIPLQGLLLQASRVPAKAPPGGYDAARRDDRPTIRIGPAPGSALSPASLVLLDAVRNATARIGSVRLTHGGNGHAWISRRRSDLLLLVAGPTSNAGGTLELELRGCVDGETLARWTLPVSGDAEAWSEQITRSLSARLEVDLTLVQIALAGQVPENRRSGRDLYHLALPLLYAAEGYDPDAAMNALDRALERHPDLGPALCAKAWVRTTHPAHNQTDQGLRETGRLARRAVDRAPQDAFVLGWAAVVLAHAERDVDTGLDFVRRALRLHPASPMALLGAAYLTHYAGDSREALRYVDAFEALEVGGPLEFLSYTIRALCDYHLGRTRDAVAAARRAVGHNPSFIVALRILAASLARSGQLEEARTVAELMVRVDRSEYLDFFRERSPYREAAMLERLLSDLRASGLPERPPDAP